MSRRPGDGRLAVENPADGTIIGEVPDARPEDGWDAATIAAEAQAEWAATSPRSRADLLAAAHREMLAREAELAAIITSETGRPIRETVAEVRYAAEFFRWFSEEAVRLGGEHRLAPDGASRIITTRTAVGPCLLITPWNFPAAMVTRKLGPALAAGCTALVKPAEQTPLTALWLWELLGDLGLPPGVVSVLPTSEPGRLVDAILDHPGIRKLSFTGSTAVGRHLQGKAAERLLRTSLELGGNAPFAVLEDADVEAAARGALVAKMRNGGQACVAANRFYVHERHLAEFTGLFVHAVESLRAGPLDDPATELGALIDGAAVAKVERLTTEAVAAGATPALRGGRPERPGAWFDPAVLTDVDPEAEIVSAEIFGPVAPIVAIQDDDQLTELVNAQASGLAAYVYTADVPRALRLVERLDVGMVGINRGFVSNPAAPFGGVRAAGFGREGGREGIADYIDIKYAALDA